MRPRYTAHAERSGAWWAVDVPEIRGNGAELRLAVEERQD